MSNDDEAIGPLTGLRVVDLTDELGAYASRLFADLGADVVRVKRPRQTPATERCVDPFARFNNAGKRSLTIDLERPDGVAILHRLLDRSDIFIQGMDPAWARAHDLDPETLSIRSPRLIVVALTPLGWDHSDVAVPDDDLTVLAAGGLLNLGGYPDAEPVAAYGRQSHVAASLFGAVGALISVLDRERTGRARWIDISAQECVAQALEDSVATFDLTGHVRVRLGSEPREAGTGIYACADGYVAMVAGRLGTTKAWHTLVAWLVDLHIPGADALTEPAWSTLTHRQLPSSIETFGEVFDRFTSQRTRQELYEEAQRRQIALSPVNDIDAVVADPQLAARGFFVAVDDPSLDRQIRYPGPPYRLSVTPAMPARPAPSRGADSDDILTEEIGMDASEIGSLRTVGVV
jgi:benzylsuccinate CoA-transferase BbsE subunit